MALTDALRSVVLAGVSPVYKDGFVHTKTLVDDGKGNLAESAPVDTPCKVQTDSVSDWMRADRGFSDKDVALLVLQTPGVTLNSDVEVTDGYGVRYTVGGFKSDPLNSYWEARGTPTHVTPVG